MKKRTLLMFLLIFLILLTTTCDGPIISITVVIPKKFVPYFDWLIDFPGLHPTPEKSIPTEIRTEYSESPSMSIG